VPDAWISPDVAGPLKRRLSAQAASCAQPSRGCGCPAQCRCRARPGAGPLALCDVPAAKGAPGRATEDMTERCDVRDACLYAARGRVLEAFQDSPSTRVAQVHPIAFPKFEALLRELTESKPGWLRNEGGRPPYSVPFVDVWLPAHFDHVYSLPLLGRQSHKSNYYAGPRTPWHDVFRKACLTAA